MIKPLSISPEFLGINVLNQWTRNNSSPRGYMFPNFLAQLVVLMNPDERLVQSGYERGMARGIFNKEFTADSVILAIVPRYRGMGKLEGVSDVVELTIVYRIIETDEIDILVVPKFDTYHSQFGFDYLWTDQLKKLRPGQTVKVGDVMAYTPSTKPNGGWGFGVNVNCCFANILGVAEDAIIISDKLRDRLGFKTYSRFSFSHGKDEVCLNLYGDDNEYKVFPDIYEEVNVDGIVCGIRRYNPASAPYRFTRQGLREFDPVFDDLAYVKKVKNKVVDIRVIHTTKKGDNYRFRDTDSQSMKYANALKKYHNDLLDILEVLETESRKDILEILPNFHRLLVEAMSLGTNGVTNVRKQASLKEFDIEIVVEHEMIPDVGFKLSGTHGNKGIVSGVIPYDEMPVDKYGNVADLISEPGSQISRMNLGVGYEQVFSAAARIVKDLVIGKFESLNKPIRTLTLSELEFCLQDTYNFYEVCNPKFGKYVEKASLEDKRDSLNVILEKEFYPLITVDETSDKWMIEKLKKTPYYYKKDRIWLTGENGKELTDEPIAIQPSYFLLLSKIADSWLSCSSAKVNHYNIPVKVSNRDRNRFPYNNTPTKTLGPSEMRSFLAHVGRLGTITLKEYSTSLITHRQICESLLTVDAPTNIEQVIDRDKIPFGVDAAVDLAKITFACNGVKSEYVEEK